MSKRELATFNFVKGDSLIRARAGCNSLSGIFDSYDSITDIFTFFPTGSGLLKSEYLADIKALIKMDA